jgi:CheY-like chemotaxis protein
MQSLQAPAQTRKWVVLLVEDEAVIRTMVADYLRDLNFIIIEVKDADEAIAVFSSATPIDLVFTDVNMPGKLDGFKLAAWISEHHPTVRIILASGVAELRNQDRGFVILQKPYSPSLLERKIRELLGMGARMAVHDAQPQR